MPGRNRKRAWVAGVAIASLAAVPLVACSDDGITPDCSSADSQCGADLTGSLDEAGDVEAAPSQDVQVVDVFVAETGPGDASLDADAHD